MTDYYKQIKDFFESENESRQRGLTSKYGYLLYANYMLDIMQSPKDSKVFEIGCGDGKIMREMRRIRSDLKFQGMDISKALITKAQEYNPNVDLYLGNVIDGLPTKETFDLIVSFSVAQYSPHHDFITMNNRLKTSLNKGGGLLFTCLYPTGDTVWW